MSNNTRINVNKSLNDLFQIILSNGFSRLRIFTAVGIEPLDPNKTWTGSSSLHLLLLDGQTSLIYERLGALYVLIYVSQKDPYIHRLIHK